MADPDDLPEPDRLPGAPHPRDASQVFGQDEAEAAFLDAYNADRLHSGWLLTGRKGIGKATLAYRIAAFLVSRPPEAGDGLFGAPPPPASLGVAEDDPDLRLIRAGAHPRLCIVRRTRTDRSDRLSDQIRAEDILALKKFFQLSAADGGHRVVIVDAADEMNPTAANGILKELEEPPARTTLLLIAHQPSRLLPTIRSRCRTLRLSPLGATDISNVLDSVGQAHDAADALTVLADGSAGSALRLLREDGLPLYATLVELFSGLPTMDRPTALKIAEACAGKGAEHRFPLTLDLIDTFLSRTARAGLHGEPAAQGAPGEARLLSRLAPDDRAARAWADLQQDVSRRARAGRAVNLDAAALILDTLMRIEATARAVVPA